MKTKGTKPWNLRTPLQNTKLPMLNKYGKLSYAICSFQGVTSDHNIKIET